MAKETVLMIKVYPKRNLWGGQVQPCGSIVTYFPTFEEAFAFAEANDVNNFFHLTGWSEEDLVPGMANFWDYFEVDSEAL